MASLQDRVTEAFENSDVAGSDRVGDSDDGLQSGDESGALGRAEASVLRAQEKAAAASGKLAELAKERVGDPTATVQNGTATATSPETLESSVVDVEEQDVADAARDVRASEGGEFAVGTTERATGGNTDMKTLTISGPDSVTETKEYQIEVSGSASGGDNLDPSDGASNGVISGSIGSLKDTYQFTGSIQSLSVPWGATVKVDGKPVNTSMSASDVEQHIASSMAGVGFRSVAIAAAGVVGLVVLLSGWSS